MERILRAQASNKLTDSEMKAVTTRYEFSKLQQALPATRPLAQPHVAIFFPLSANTHTHARARAHARTHAHSHR